MSPKVSSGATAQGKLVFKKSVPPQALSDFFDHLVTLLASGIPLLTALEFIRGATKHKVLRDSLDGISSKIRSGSQLSEALAQRPDIFDRVVLGMLRASEASGQLEAILKELAQAFAKRAEMRSRFLQAIAYPVLVACFGAVTVAVLLVFVVPKLTSVFEIWDAPLPLVTRILLGVSGFLTHGGFLVLALLAAGFVVFLSVLGSEKRKQMTFSLLSAVPFFKQLFFLTDFVRLTRTWGMLLRSGVPLIDAIRASEDVLWEPKMRKSLQIIREKTVRGSALRQSIREENWFPELAKNFLSVGEETGTLDQSFDKIASFYERELDQNLKLFATFLEPMLILAIGLIVGFLVISLLLPIFEMSLVVR